MFETFKLVFSRDVASFESSHSSFRRVGSEQLDESMIGFHSFPVELLNVCAANLASILISKAVAPVKIAYASRDVFECL
jgi:hypothetical protein